MKLVKVIAGSVIIALLTALALAVTNYTPLSERSPDTYYFSIMESFTFSAVYLTPIIVIAGPIAYLLYNLFKKRSRLSKVSNIFTSTALSVSLVIAAISLYIFIERKYNVTNDIYLIPEGYEGDVFVFYNVDGASPIETEDGFEVHTINEDGYFVTSTPNMEYGRVTDRYYYVDESGKRTPIDQECVSGFGTGGTESDGYSINFTGFRLSATQCSQDFMVNGFVDGYDESQKTVLNHVLKQYYNIEETD